MADDWPELILNANEWESADDVYTGFFEAVGAPPWHGRNLDALNDSIGTGNINAVEVPYHLKILGTQNMGEAAKEMTDRLVALVGELADAGVPVAISCEP